MASSVCEANDNAWWYRCRSQRKPVVSRSWGTSRSTTSTMIGPGMYKLFTKFECNVAILTAFVVLTHHNYEICCQFCDFQLHNHWNHTTVIKLAVNLVSFGIPAKIQHWLGYPEWYLDYMQGYNTLSPYLNSLLLSSCYRCTELKNFISFHFRGKFLAWMGHHVKAAITIF